MRPPFVVDRDHRTRLQNGSGLGRLCAAEREVRVKKRRTGRTEEQDRDINRTGVLPHLIDHV